MFILETIIAFFISFGIILLFYLFLGTGNPIFDFNCTMEVSNGDPDGTDTGSDLQQ